VLIRMALGLPRDARYVGVMREVAGCILTELHAPQEAVDDIQLAVTEACANAVRHAVGTADYSVRFAVGQDSCEIEIVDIGPGFTPEDEGEAQHDPESESGRGLTLIRALVDDLEFTRDGADNRIRLTKTWPSLGVPTPPTDGLPHDLSQAARAGDEVR
jgi:serine/threonine-protein kinase RsbW